MFGFLAHVLAWCYDLVPNYFVAITLFTLLIMVVLTPFNIKGMRSMAEMARLQPEMKRLQDQYKNDRVRMNEEMQALFKEHKVNPLGGCLPTLLPFPVLFVMFRLLEHLTGKHAHHLFDPRRVLNTLPDPHYLAHTSKLYTSLVNNGGKMVSFGFDLGKAARSAHGTSALPYYLLIILMTISQYVMQQQINKRNPQAAAANPQMKLTMQIFPIFYAVISLNLAASVVLYLLISGLFRMGQNILSYKYDPKLQLAPIAAGASAKVIETTGKPKDGSGGFGKGKLGRAQPGGGGQSGGGGQPDGGRDKPSRPSRESGAGDRDRGSDRGSGQDAADADRGSKGLVNVRKSGNGRVTPRGDRSKPRRGR